MMHLPVLQFHTLQAPIYSLLLPTTFTILTLRRMRLLCIMKKVSEKPLVEQAVQNKCSHCFGFQEAASSLQNLYT